MPHGTKAFQVELDFLGHRLHVQVSDGRHASLPLEPQPVAACAAGFRPVQGAPQLPDWVARDAYSHEVSSAGFWAGNEQHPYAMFYSYAYPEPAGFAQAAVRPASARYSAELREFILPYDAVRESPSPDDTLLEFLQSTYEAAAGPRGWDHA